MNVNSNLHSLLQGQLKSQLTNIFNIKRGMTIYTSGNDGVSASTESKILVGLT